jgi:hypothetical protein
VEQHNSGIDCSVGLISESFNTVIARHSLDTILAGESAESGIVDFECLLASPHKPEMAISLNEAFLNDLANHRG